jgi:hypothetical protein
MRGNVLLGADLLDHPGLVRELAVPQEAHHPNPKQRHRYTRTHPFMKRCIPFLANPRVYPADTLCDSELSPLCVDPNEDSDVTVERQKIESGVNNSELVVVKNLAKVC